MARTSARRRTCVFGSLTAVGAAAFGVLTGAASPQSPETRIYVLHSRAAGTCPALDWHIVVEPNDVVAGMIAWNGMKRMARATGKINRRNNAFTMKAVEMGGAARTAIVDGQIGDDGTITANIKGPNVTCYSVIVRVFDPSQTK
jgi:hypothetical protein